MYVEPQAEHQTKKQKTPSPPIPLQMQPTPNKKIPPAKRQERRGPVVLRVRIIKKSQAHVRRAASSPLLRCPHRRATAVRRLREGSDKRCCAWVAAGHRGRGQREEGPPPPLPALVRHAHWEPLVVPASVANSKKRSCRCYWQSKFTPTPPVNTPSDVFFALLLHH